MPYIHERGIMVRYIKQGILLIKTQGQYPSVDVTVEKIADELKERTVRTIKSWMVPSGMPSSIDDYVLIRFVWMVLTKGQGDLAWVVGLLGATSIPVPKSPSRDWVYLYLKGGWPEGKAPSDTEINDVVNRIYREEEVYRADVLSSKQQTILVHSSAPELTILKSEAQQQRFLGYMNAIYGLVILLVFIPIVVTGSREGFFNDWANLYFLIALLGGVLGYLRIGKLENASNNSYYHAVTNLCYGLISWSFGGIIWLCYNLTGNKLPYPSLADLCYILTPVFLLIGIHHMHRVIGKSITQKIPTTIIMALVFCSFFAKIMLDIRTGTVASWRDGVKFFLDVYYPSTDLIVLTSISFLLGYTAFKTQEIKFKKSVYVIFLAVILELVADFSFSITTTLPENNQFYFYNGNWTDFAFATAFYIMARGILIMPYDSNIITS